MARDTLGYEYTGVEDTAQMFSEEVNDDVVTERLERIFKDMPPFTPCPVQEYSAARPPNEVGSRGQSPKVLVAYVVVLMLVL
jgi:hypothetical protein